MCSFRNWRASVALLLLFVALLTALRAPWFQVNAAEEATASPTTPQAARVAGLEIPSFSPAAESTDLPSEADVALLARLREQIGSPLESPAWKAHSGSSPLERPTTARTSVESVAESPAAVISQMRTTAHSLERVAARLEEERDFEHADQLRDMAEQIWKGARAIQGWSKAE